MCVVWLFPLPKCSLNAQRWNASLAIYLCNQVQFYRKKVCVPHWGNTSQPEKSAEMGETTNSSWYLKQCSLKSSSQTTCKWRSRPAQLTNSKHMLISPANFSFFSPHLLWWSELCYLVYIGASGRRDGLTPTLVNPRGWISIWSIPQLGDFIKSWIITNLWRVSLYYFTKYTV